MCSAPLAPQQKAHVSGHTFDRSDIPSKLRGDFKRCRARIDHIDERLYLALGPLLRFVISHAPRSDSRARIPQLFRSSELNARQLDFGCAEIVFASGAEVEQNFVTGAAAFLLVHLTRPVWQCAGRSENIAAAFVVWPAERGPAQDYGDERISTERLIPRIPLPYSRHAKHNFPLDPAGGLGSRSPGSLAALGTAERSGGRRWRALCVRVGLDRLTPPGVS